MSIVLDLVVVIVVLLLIFGGYRNGVIKSFAELGCTIISSLISSFLGSIVSVRLYELFLRDAIIKTITDALPDYSAMMRSSDIANSIMNDSPEFVKNAIELTGIDSKALTDKIVQLEKTNIPMQLESMVRPVVLKVFTVLVTVILFIVSVVLISIAAKFLTKTVDITGLSGVNKAFGALIGIVEAFVLLMILSLIIYMLTVMLPTDLAQGLRDAIDATYIYKIIFYIDYPDTIINSVINV